MGYTIFQSCHGWLGCQWYVVWIPTYTHLQYAVMAKSITIIGILEACGYLHNTLANQLRNGMH